MIAWDFDAENPNPHALELDSTEYPSFEAAVKEALDLAEDEDETGYDCPFFVVSQA